MTGTSIFGRVKLFHVREDILQSSSSTVIDQAKLQSVSRLGGISYGRYPCVSLLQAFLKELTRMVPCRTTKGLELARPVWAEESQREEVKAVLNRRPQPDL